jgi:hypothetical protein
MKLSPGFRVAYWLVLVLSLGRFLLLRLEDAVAGRATGADIVIFAVWVALLLAPLFSEVQLLGVKLKQAVEEAKSDIKREISSVRSDIAAAITVNTSLSQNFHFSADAGSIRSDESSIARVRQPLEFKILNTLWTKQVNKWPDRSQLFTFRINAGSPEFLQFREAASKLMGEQLVGETDSGQLYLTDGGFQYCKSNHKTFPIDQWWPQESINAESLQRVLSAGS